jgi:NADH dehydrogenase FAD-containing subunit
MKNSYRAPVKFASGASISSDAIIWTIGNRKAHTDFLPEHLLDEDRFVKTLPTLEVQGTENIFAIGDVASTDPERSSARNWAYGVLVHNLRRKAKGKPANKAYVPPANRWGSIVGPQENGLTLHQADGKRIRLSKRLVDTVFITHDRSPLYLSRGKARPLRRGELRGLFSWKADKRVNE